HARVALLGWAGGGGEPTVSRPSTEQAPSPAPTPPSPGPSPVPGPPAPDPAPPAPEPALRRAAEKGLLVLLAPAYLGFAGRDQGWYEEMKANGAAKMRA